MTTLKRTFARAAVKATMVAVTTYVSVFTFRLGWFIPFVVFAGAVAAWVVTRTERRVSSNAALLAIVAMTSYLLVIVSLFSALTGQVSYRTFPVTWHDQGPANYTGQAEIYLESKIFPDMA